MYAGTFIERKKCAITWHYRKADHEFAALQAAECQALLESTIAKEYDLEVMPGKCNLEIRPRFVNKGEIAKTLIASYKKNGNNSKGFVLCSGDDTTDEGEFSQPAILSPALFNPRGWYSDYVVFSSLIYTDMFRALRASDLPRAEFFTVHIGPSSKHTVADYHLLEPSDMIESIGLLVGIVSPVDLGIIPAVIEVGQKEEDVAAAA